MAAIRDEVRGHLAQLEELLAADLVKRIHDAGVAAGRAERDAERPATEYEARQRRRELHVVE